MAQNGTESANIILTGFMGTGKSTVGRIIADRLGMPFVDTDIEIEAAHGPIPTIFADQGEARFRELERALVADLADRPRPIVIAAGGGLLLDADNATTLASTGPVFALTADPAEIVRRVTPDGLGMRPLLGEDPVESVLRLLGERAVVYDAFKRVCTDGRDPEAVATEIIEGAIG